MEARIMRRLIAVTGLIAVALSACSGSPATPSPSPTPTPKAAVRSVSVVNGTTVPVAVSVNGTVMETIQPGTTEDPIHATLPALPWTVEARSPSGRVLATLTVSAADYLSSASGRSAVEDLACGRLAMWSGAPVGGGPSFIPDAARPCD